MSTDPKTSLTDGERSTVTAALVAGNEKAAAKLFAKQRKDFDLHVSLIERKEGIPASWARARAWLEGPGGLTRRLNP